MATYILDEDGNPKLEPDLRAWSTWMVANPDKLRVALDYINQNTVEVSTMFCGINPPALFETMVFDRSETKRPFDQLCIRSETRERAIFVHTQVVIAITAYLLTGSDTKLQELYDEI